MVGVSRVLLLLFAFVCLALLAYESRIESLDHPINAESLRHADFRHGPRATGSLLAPAAVREAALIWAGETSPGKEQDIPADQSPSIIEMLEGRESDLLLWVSIAVVFFMVGWICGGNYHLRRDRVRRRKLRF
jgi:hypothetical protein